MKGKERREGEGRGAGRTFLGIMSFTVKLAFSLYPHPSPFLMGEKQKGAQRPTVLAGGTEEIPS